MIHSILSPLRHDLTRFTKDSARSAKSGSAERTPKYGRRFRVRPRVVEDPEHRVHHLQSPLMGHILNQSNGQKIMPEKGQKQDTRTIKSYDDKSNLDSFVLDKGIFSGIFEKDIRRVYIYKKAERLAKAIHLVVPAFVNSPALRNRVDTIAVGLVDAAILPPASARQALARELLALSSVLSIARAGALLSAMNSDLITREAHTLLQEIATYEEPRLFFEEAPTLAALFKTMESTASSHTPSQLKSPAPVSVGGSESIKDNKGHIKVIPAKPSRREAILSVLKLKGPSYIKDISTVIREVSEKTIQRELALLVSEGLVTRKGERRWSVYSLSS